MKSSFESTCASARLSVGAVKALVSSSPRGRLRPLALACAAVAAPVWAQNAGPAAPATSASAASTSVALPDVVVTAVHEHSPLLVVADPKQPRQPVPASDAADYLKSIPGFTAIRSGGSNSDPVFRGQFGSRLPVLTNGATLLGACPARMDSPSSYISPETFDALTVVKGPQTVIWGPGASAGVVRFDRERPDLERQQVQFSASVQGGTAARSDQNVDLLVGSPDYYLRFTANHSQSKDYKDGDGRIVPSHWDKWNADVAFGLTPDKDTLIELSAGTGDGEARYGGRGMDGAKFRRESVGLRLEKSHLSPLLAKLEAQLYYHQADHVMDNYSLRQFKPGGGMSMPMAANPRRTTKGLRVASTWNLGQHTSLVAGVDAMDSPHDQRSGMPSMPYAAKPYVRDAKFTNQGLFAELTQHVSDSAKVVGGLRLDRAKAWRYPAPSAGGMEGMHDMDGMHDMKAMGDMHDMHGMAPMPHAMAPVSNQRERSALPSGFVRWEQTLGAGTTVYAGIGHVQRFPDYWELISPGNSAAGKGNAFGTLKPEKTTQIDVGANWKAAEWQAWTSAYLGHVQDYILFNYPSMGGMGGMGSTVRNVSARTAGFEVGGSYQLGRSLTAQGTLAYAWAENRTDHRPLPQTPPLEAKFGLDWSEGAWNAGALWRVVAAQKRYARDQGNVVGKDFGPSGGFGVMSVNAGYRVNQTLKVTAGIDNLFNRTYAEHLNLAGNADFGFPGGVRINEPGRTLWVRGDIKF